ncbi:hypothetical protein [Opitutus sp. ER46]|uniref:hypothetical protein n=1 Tax=Opitutus sp. ER46 TaxID=2161864 RepID=UPI000D31F172|nr:hypothetical protein [Opitutus sp. ER46]PTX95789.1 hypothetical protein DB354_10285 [Opitutus sp. ER46]
MHNLPVFGLGLFFALAGLGLFAYTLRKTAPAPAPVKKAELRELEARQAETNKLRIAAAVGVVVGAALMVLS